MVHIGHPDGSETVSRSFGSAVRALAFDPGDHRLAVAGDSGGVEVWGLANPDALIETLEWPVPVHSLAISPDGSILAAGDAEGGLRLWNLVTPDEGARDLSGHIATVTALRFHPEGALLASSSLDRSVRLWNVQEEKPEPLELEGHRSWVWGVDFSENGQTLASASEDRSVRFWSTQTNDLAREACGRVSRNLSEEEWARYLPELPFEETCPGAGLGGAVQQ